MPMTERLKEISKDIQRLQKVYANTASGNELQMIGPMLQAMTITGAGLSIKTGVAPLFLSLCIASSGVGAENGLGFVGKDLNLAIDKMVEALLSPNIWKEPASGESELLLKKIITALWIGTISGAHLIVKQGLGKNSKENDEAFVFSCELALTMIASSNILRSTIHELLIACGANEKAQEIATDVLTLATFLLLIKTMEEAANLFDTTSDYLLRSMNTIESATETPIALKQAILALQEGRSEELTDILNNFIGSLQIDLKNDLTAIGTIAVTIYDSCTNLEAPSGAEIHVVA
jgi:hypothetical protein